MIEYRTATAADMEAVALLHTRSWRENYRGSLRDEFLDGALPEERLRVWRERLERPAGSQFVLLALQGAELVGFVCAYGAHDPKWGSLVDNLHVAGEARRTGVGTALMRRAGAWLDRAHPDRGVYLWVLEVNATARRFYERLGARNAETVTMETHGASMVRSCRYVWPRPERLASAPELAASGAEKP